MLLAKKNAVIYGGGGSIGGAVARAFAKEGAKVFLTGHRNDSLQRIAGEIISAGGFVETAVVDALDALAINAHLSSVVSRYDSIDIIFNAIDTRSVQNITLVDMKLEDFERPIHIAMKTHFLTATAAGRIMMKQRSGVILSITATPGGIGYPLVGGFGPACCAVESFSRDLASELGPYGVRVVNIRSGGSPDSRPFIEALTHNPVEVEIVLGNMEDDTMLKELPLINDIGNVAVFLGSHWSSKITGVTIDVTCGTTNGLNYKTPTLPLLK